MTRFERVFGRQKPVIADAVGMAGTTTWAQGTLRLRDRIDPSLSRTGSP